MFGRGKKTFEKINTPEKIQSIAANTHLEPIILRGNVIPNEEDNHDIPYCADGYYFRKGTFSKALAKLVDKHWNMAGGDEKNFFFLTLNDVVEHAMALRLKRQDGCMKVIFYDPNATLRHKTFLLSEPGLAEHITDEDLRIRYYKGVLMNIDDSKKSVDECDIQFFGSSHSTQFKFLAEHTGHVDHPLFR